LLGLLILVTCTVHVHRKRANRTQNSKTLFPKRTRYGDIWILNIQNAFAQHNVVPIFATSTNGKIRAESASCTDFVLVYGFAKSYPILASNGMEEHTVRVCFLRAFSGHHVRLRRVVLRGQTKSSQIGIKLPLSDLSKNPTSLFVGGLY